MGTVAVADGPKIGSRNFTAFCAQAERCYLHALLSDDQDNKERWVSLGDAWLALADKFGSKRLMMGYEPLNNEDVHQNRTLN
jgi:hypothetical protein